MARLTITVGKLSASVMATDASAAKVLANYIAAYNLDPDGKLSPREQLQAVVEHLARHINAVSIGHQRRKKYELAGEEVEQAREELNET